MDNNIVSFIESIEPDLSYEGSMGAIALIVECNENMDAIEGRIYDNIACESAYLEAEEKGIIDKAKEYGGKAKAGALKIWDWIVTAIKNAISKIKGLFFQAVKKAKVLYAQAMNKIRQLLAKATKKGGIVKTEWMAVGKRLNEYIAAFNNHDFGINSLEKTAKGKDENDLNAEKFDVTPSSILKEVLGAGLLGKGDSSGKIGELSAYMKETCMQKRTEIAADSKTLEKEFAGHLKTLNDLYGNIMKKEEKMLATVVKLRNMAHEGKAGSASATYANRMQSAISSACTIFFNGVFGVIAKALHQAIKATLIAIKSNVSDKVGSAVDTVKDTFSSKKEDADLVLL